MAQKSSTAIAFSHSAPDGPIRGILLLHFLLLQIKADQHRTRRLVARQDKDSRCRTDRIEVRFDDILAGISVNKLIAGEYEVEIPLGFGHSYKLHLYNGEIDFDDIVRLRQRVAEKIDEMTTQIRRIRDIPGRVRAGFALKRRRAVEAVCSRLMSFRKQERRLNR